MIVNNLNLILLILFLLNITFALHESYDKTLRLKETLSGDVEERKEKIKYFSYIKCEQIPRTLRKEANRSVHVKTWSNALSLTVSFPEDSFYRFVRNLFKRFGGLVSGNPIFEEGTYMRWPETFYTAIFMLLYFVFGVLSLIYTPLLGWLLFTIYRMFFECYNSYRARETVRAWHIKKERSKRKREWYLYPFERTRRRPIQRYVLAGYTRHYSEESVPSELDIDPENLPYTVNFSTESEIDLEEDYKFLRDSKIEVRDEDYEFFDFVQDTGTGESVKPEKMYKFVTKYIDPEVQEERVRLYKEGKLGQDSSAAKKRKRSRKRSSNPKETFENINKRKSLEREQSPTSVMDKKSKDKVVPSSDSDIIHIEFKQK